MITDRLREMWADELEREYGGSKRKKREKRIRTRSWGRGVGGEIGDQGGIENRGVDEKGGLRRGEGELEEGIRRRVKEGKRRRERKGEEGGGERQEEECEDRR